MLISYSEPVYIFLYEFFYMYNELEYNMLWKIGLASFLINLVFCILFSCIVLMSVCFIKIPLVPKMELIV